MCSHFIIAEPENINFDDVPVHVLTTLVKSFFRELEEPLITQELYENFVNVSGWCLLTKNPTRVMKEFLASLN